jgi:hypothetical protein
VTLEIRSYNLRPGSRDAFHRLFVDESLPMLHRWKVDVVAYGPSAHDEDSWYLMRAYGSLADRDASQDAFYSSDEWLSGPREELLSYIESYATVVLELDGASVDGLRGAG